MQSEFFWSLELVSLLMLHANIGLVFTEVVVVEVGEWYWGLNAHVTRVSFAFWVKCLSLGDFVD